MIDLSGTYLGIVEDIDDPLKIGRCRARVGFLFGKDIPTSDLPWAYPIYPTTFGKAGLGGTVSIPKKGGIVRITFQDGDIYSPEFYGTQELADDVKTFIKSQYEGTHVLLYDGDENLKIYYNKDKGLRLELQGSYINIGNDKTITIEHANSESMTEYSGGTITTNANTQITNTAVTLIQNHAKEVWCKGDMITKLGPTPKYSAVLGEPLFLILGMMAASIDAKMFPTPGVMAGLVEQAKLSTLSKTVMVSN